MARLTCYDGVGCIGGNKLLLEDGGTKLWLDFGLNFGRMGTYYAEFLQPKIPLGLYEPIQMGLLPPVLDLYRSDLVASLADPWSGIAARRVGDVDGVLLSHAHMDHIGALAYVRPDIPVYASAMSLAIAKSTQDTGVGGFSNHYCYVSPYEVSDGGVLASTRSKKRPSIARPYVFVDEQPSDGFSEFWNMTPSSTSKYGRQHEPSSIALLSKCGDLNVRRYPVDHSVYGACAWAVETSAGWVVYTGDVRCHGGNCASTWKFAEEVSKLNPRLLIIEGTRIDNEGTSTEDQVRDRALEEVRKAKGLVVADFGPRNVERLVSFLQIAKETGRKLLLLNKDAYLLDAMFRASKGGEIPPPDDDSILIYGKYEASESSWKKLVRDRYPADKFVDARDVSANQSSYICCFSFFDVNELACIRPVPGSIWIYSSCEPFSEEMQIDFDRLGAWLDRYEMPLLGGTRDEEKSPFHVSGHACRTDLLKIVDTINPRTLVPVHCEKPEKYLDALHGKCEVILPEVGIPIDLR